MINFRWVVQSWEELQEVLRSLLQQLRQVHRTYGMLYRSGATTQVINNAATKITIFNTAESDGVTASHSDDKLTVINAGLYAVNGHISLAASGGSGNVTCQAYANGSVLGVATGKAWVGSGEYADLRVNTIVSLEQGDYIELYCLGGGGLTYDIGACSLMIKRIG